MADVILLQIKYKEKLYEIPADLNSTAVRYSYLKGIDEQAEGLKYINISEIKYTALKKARRLCSPTKR